MKQAQQKVPTIPQTLSILTGLKVINTGILGEISSQGLKRLPALLDQHHPELLILIRGGNNLLKRISKRQISNNLLQMIDESHQRKIKVVLSGVHKPMLLLLKSAKFYKV